MEKEDGCATCVHRTGRKFCERWRLQTPDCGRCMCYEGRRRFLDGPAKWCVIVVVPLVALCFILTLPYWADAKVEAEPDERMGRTELIGPVNDRPGPAVTEQREAEAKVAAEDEEVAPEEKASAEEEPSAASFPGTAGDSVLTEEGGVNYFNGMRETWYSSNVLRHYRIDEWHCGDDGVWRDEDGYVIIASSDFPMGTMRQTSLGPAKVYDTGCPSGTVDIYVNW